VFVPIFNVDECLYGLPLFSRRRQAKLKVALAVHVLPEFLSDNRDVQEAFEGRLVPLLDAWQLKAIIDAFVYF